jgi:hypothetical protein
MNRDAQTRIYLLALSAFMMGLSVERAATRPENIAFFVLWLYFAVRNMVKLHAELNSPTSPR